MNDTIFKFAFLLSLVFACSVLAQETPSEQGEKLTPSFGFPSVAVVKLDDKSVLQILLPSATVPAPGGPTVTEQYAVNENGVQVFKERTRPAAYLPDKFRMVRTELSSDKIKLRDQSGKVIDMNEISQLIRKPTHVLLIQGESIDSSRRHFFREGVLLLSTADLDPNCWYSPEVGGLNPKWIRTEPLPKPAVAQLVENSTKLEVVFVKVELTTEIRMRTVKLANDVVSEQTYSVEVPVYSTSKELLDIDECVITSVDGETIGKQAAIERLLQPTHILWDSNITGYLASVMKPELGPELNRRRQA